MFPRTYRFIYTSDAAVKNLSRLPDWLSRADIKKKTLITGSALAFTSLHPQDLLSVSVNIQFYKETSRYNRSSEI